MSIESEIDTTSGRAERVAIIGAGLAGLTCARELSLQGHDVHLFEKRETVSGRMARIRMQPDRGAKQAAESVWFDHGAQYFTARSVEFSQQVHDWENRGVVQQWLGPFVKLTNGVCEPPPGNDVRYVGVPGMDAICSDLLQQICKVRSCKAENPNAASRAAKITFCANVLPLQRVAQRWQVRYENTQSGVTAQPAELFDWVVLALPSPIAQSLLPGDSPLIQQIAPFKLGPCLAVMMAFDRSLSLPFGGAFVQNSLLRWISNNSSMPQRKKTPECWILHPSSEWSAEHWNASEAAIIGQVHAAFEKATAMVLPEPRYQALFRWENALPLQPAASGCFSDLHQRVIIAGDWCTDARVEGAFLSGLQAARRLSEEMMKQ